MNTPDSQETPIKPEAKGISLQDIETAIQDTIDGKYTYYTSDGNKGISSAIVTETILTYARQRLDKMVPDEVHAFFNVLGQGMINAHTMEGDHFLEFSIISFHALLPLIDLGIKQREWRDGNGHTYRTLHYKDIESKRYYLYGRE